ncbi:MAG: hypothetical protein IT209_04960 [Armatimonadetes bacterium]|nr:hypothetical protein [Armatimonadota bacterium]
MKKFIAALTLMVVLSAAVIPASACSCKAKDKKPAPTTPAPGSLNS